MNTLVTAYHQNAPTVRRVGAWLGAALMVASMVLTSLPELGVDRLWIEGLAWLGGALGGAVLFPAASRALKKWLAGGGGVLLVVAAQWLAATWPASMPISFLAALLTGLGGLAKTAAWVTAPDLARVSVAPPQPDADITPIDNPRLRPPPPPRA